MLVRDAMTSDPVTVTAGSTLKAAATALARHRISALPVVDGDHLVRGVVSEADLLLDAFPPDRRSHLIPPRARPATADTTVGEVMTTPAITVHAATDVVEVIGLMRTHGFKSLPVVDDAGGLVGVISRSDLVRFRAREDEDVRDEVRALFRELDHPAWLVEVVAGEVVVTGPGTAADRAVAEAGAATVPGVVGVTTNLA